jgi:hypothetical protein
LLQDLLRVPPQGADQDRHQDRPEAATDDHRPGHGTPPILHIVTLPTTFPPHGTYPKKLLDVLDGPQPNQAKIYPSSGPGVEGAVIEREKTVPKYRHLS